jgi:hypothetical protein
VPDPVDHLPGNDAGVPADISIELWRLLSAGDLDLPLPGAGQTARRFRALAELGRADLCLAKIAEAHADADAILAELTGARVQPGELWAVWAAQPPTAVVRAYRDPGIPQGWRVDGRKAWCSGAALCTHALITAVSPDGPMLMAVDLRHDGASPAPSAWAGPGMGRAGTAELILAQVPASAVGQAGQYLSRAGFWQGAIGVAAVWLGGAAALGDALLGRARSGHLDAHGLAHLGAVDAALTGAWALLEAVAARIDAAPLADCRIDALRTRAVAEDAVATALSRTARALGPGPFATDRRYALTAADLPVYVRQSHAERDLAQLGQAIAAAVHASPGSPRW